MTTPPQSGALAVLGLVLVAGCGRHVIKVETDPGDAMVTVNGSPSKENRWSTKDSLADVVAMWPDGTSVKTKVTVFDDVVIRVHKDGDPAGLKAPILAASGPRGVAVIEGQPTVKGLSAGSPAGGGDDAIFAKARALYEEGQRAYELADYDVAIGKFQDAYSLVRQSQSPDTAEILSNVVFNIAVVFEKSFELKPDPERLRKARIFYQQYDQRMSELVADWAQNPEHADVLARIRAIEVRLAEVEKKK